MPNRALTTCSEPRCNVRVRSGKCAKHRSEAEADLRRRQPWRYVYTDPRWEPLKRRVLAEQPRCDCPPECCPGGCGRPSRVVDHRIPHRGDERLAFDRANLHGMARVCHDRKTGRENAPTGSR